MTISMLGLRWPQLRLLLLFIPFIALTLVLRAAIHSTSLPPEPNNQKPQFRTELVVASLKGDDTSWLHEHFPDWKANIYIVDDQKAEMTVPTNKGREAMVYLTWVQIALVQQIPNRIFTVSRYIIDHYHQFPDIMVFMHSLRYQWHNDEPLYGIPRNRL